MSDGRRELETRGLQTVSARQAGRSAIDRVQVVQHVMGAVMKQDVHFGVIPGTPKPTLYKAGADALALAFKLAPSYHVDIRELDGDHREYSVTCVMTAADGSQIAEGVGSCSTKERKYRYFRDGSERPDVADVWNTCLKMAKKRAHVDATLTATGAADMFAQDLEDMDEPPTDGEAPEPIKMPSKKRASAKPQEKVQAKPPIIQVTRFISGVPKIETRKGATNGREWELYNVTIGGVTATTFDKKIAKSAQVAEDGEIKMVMHWTEDGKRKTIATLELAGGEPNAMPAGEAEEMPF